ncbi:hypothetical protein FEM54_27980 [Pseudomonas edaphica]|uniref:Uncharacterized protein n=1 Tax=Pseudomonas edaphica TaxID=2006980 RepID=A0ABY2TXM7_9PSED|nr:hypothetical protein FEM54_27980 [Pseudomonas edaphica]
MLFVGADLPAVQPTRCNRQTELMPSQASQLPHLNELASGCVTMPTTLSQHQNQHDRPQHTQTTAQEA